MGWEPGGQSGPWAAVLDGADALVNLSGASIEAERWTPQRKALLRDSRILPTRSLVRAMAAVEKPPQVFISGSAVGYYGSSGDALRPEEAPPGTDFLAHLGEDWEAEARKAESPRARVVLLRTGVVLERSGGALAKMIPPFRMGVGGPMGSGRQYMPWIHRIDWVEMVRWLVDTPQASGAFNATAPEPVENRVFARALGGALHRPALVPAPGFALRLMFGEMADAIMLAGQRAIPAKAQRMHFHFRYPTLDQAFRGIFGE